MVEDGPLADRRRALEEEYFRGKDKELVERMRREQAAAAERRRLSEATGITDDLVLDQLQRAGFTADTAILLNLVPAIEVAWAEAPVPDAERDLILEAAQLQGVQSGSEAAKQLDAWLSRPPSKDVYEAALRAIIVMLNTQSGDAGAATRRSLIDLCTHVASGSGGVFGFGKVSSEERKVIERLVATLAPKQDARARATSDEA